MTTVMIIIFGIVSMFVLITLITGMALHDIRSVRTVRAAKLHPYAKKWRNRPTIWVPRNGISSDQNLHDIRKNGYRKIKFISGEEKSGHGLILRVPPHSALPHGSLKEAVMQLNSSADLPSVELLVMISQPASSVGELFSHYRVMLSAPIAAMRNGFGIGTTSSPFPTLCSSSHSHESVVVSTAKRAFHVVNLILFSYAIYTALMMARPELLLLYLGAFSLWAAWSVIRYPYAPLRLKAIYLLLFPASIAYFVYRLVTAPLRSLRLQPRLQNAIIR